ncbi:nuclear transport factor 2 family protein [Nocardia jiangxiensis]|uniref:nuclear transport factor 2 family protein n=1 Tax=Nocardia jiangxiensis TaxID=282685 RepID=UPI0002EE1714|nr:nuclear transport factor 2 family protein [Nocardia jiangxiensis]
MTTENKEITRLWLNDLFNEPTRWDRAVDTMAEDVQWHVEGSTDISGLHNDREDFRPRVIVAMETVLESVEWSVDNIFAEGDLVCAQSTGKNLMKNGIRYSNRYVHVFRIRDGKIQEG